MQTQGILETMKVNSTAKMSKAKTSKKDCFSDVMVQVSGQKDVTTDKKDSMKTLVQDTSMAKEDINSIPDDKRLVLTKTDSSEEEIPDAMLMQIGQQIVTTIADTLELLKQDIVDMMKDMGFDVSDFLSSNGNGTFTISAQITVTVKTFVMGVHGITDETAFLTNEDLSAELDQLVDNITELLTNELPKILASMTNKSNQSDIPVQNIEQQVQQNSDISMTVDSNMNQSTNLQQDSDTDTETNTNISDQVTAIDDSVEETVETEPKSNVFVEKMNEALENVTTRLNNDKTVMKQDIVQQVVRQIKVRVLPETTRMELTLHPESLGKVNIVISQSSGITSASMTVQSTAAKEALESQLIALKETFAEKGLKVDSVEVTVSDFGFQKESDQSEQQQKGNKKSHTHLSIDALEDDVEVEEEETIMSENSVIDYTA